MGAKGRQSNRSSGRGRFALILFGGIFVVLFVVVAASEGITTPTPPEGDAAIVTGLPGDMGNITEEDVENTIAQQVAETGGKPPKPGEKFYYRRMSVAMNELTNALWIEAESEDMGIQVTDKQVEDELEKIKKQSFPTEAAWQAFLKKSHLTPDEVQRRVKLQVINTQVQEQVKAEAPVPTEEELEEAYDEEKAERFSTKESRDVRVIANEDKSEVDAALKELEKDHSPASWKKVAKKYSTDEGTNEKGGLQPGVQEEFLPESLKGPIYGAATGELVGPLKVENTYLIVEVVKLNPEKTKSFAEAKAEVSATLTEKRQEEVFAAFYRELNSKWKSRTFCARGFITEPCANTAEILRNSEANPACYEAHPKEPLTGCPAPVKMNKPALPGTVSFTKPQGDGFVQRPLPPAEEEAAAEAPAAPEEAPEAEPPGE
ncbi:MAG TPA: peptidyl-prolyl cis-trans isomerase [Solirubrobacterales bacterium]|nr:peptidyl-prolyl cis-trans isomerase [Solirubrobacterales bacterium]